MYPGKRANRPERDGSQRLLSPTPTNHPPSQPTNQPTKRFILGSKSFVGSLWDQSWDSDPVLDSFGSIVGSGSDVGFFWDPCWHPDLESILRSESVNFGIWIPCWIPLVHFGIQIPCWIASGSYWGPGCKGKRCVSDTTKLNTPR